MILNRKGGKYLSLWWFVMMTVVGVAIAAGIFTFYRADFDSRQLESQVLMEKAQYCLLSKGIIDEDFFKDSFNFGNYCALEGELFGDKGVLFVGATLSGDSGIITRWVSGPASLEKDCAATRGIRAEYYPQCSEKRIAVIYSKDGELKMGSVSIVAASNNKVRSII